MAIRNVDKCNQIVDYKETLEYYKYLQRFIVNFNI